MTHIYGNLDLGKYTTSSFLDLAKAFDSLDRKILLEKHEHYGVRHNALKLFKSYFFATLQYVEYNNFKSSPMSVEYGAPQGNIVGPILFMNCINDITICVLDTKFVLFADDTSVMLLVIL